MKDELILELRDYEEGVTDCLAAEVLGEPCGGEGLCGRFVQPLILEPFKKRGESIPKNSFCCITSPPLARDTRDGGKSLLWNDCFNVLEGGLLIMSVTIYILVIVVIAGRGKVIMAKAAPGLITITGKAVCRPGAATTKRTRPMPRPLTISTRFWTRHLLKAERTH
jgi:hypothetical protein